MRQIFTVFNKFLQVRCYSTFNSDLNMEVILKNIFHAAVDSVKPSELFAINNILSLNKIDNTEVIEIKQKDLLYQLDITNKNIHIGN